MKIPFLRRRRPVVDLSAHTPVPNRSVRRVPTRFGYAVDEEVVALVEMLNELDMPTESSCQGGAHSCMTPVGGREHPAMVRFVDIDDAAAFVAAVPDRVADLVWTPATDPVATTVMWDPEVTPTLTRTFSRQVTRRFGSQP